MLSGEGLMIEAANACMRKAFLYLTLYSLGTEAEIAKLCPSTVCTGRKFIRPIATVEASICPAFLEDEGGFTGRTTQDFFAVDANRKMTHAPMIDKEKCLLMSYESRTDSVGERDRERRKIFLPTFEFEIDEEYLWTEVTWEW
jgi:hypothetical protein